MSDDVLTAVGEMKAELVRQGMILDQVHRQTSITNGRVSDLENWKHALQLIDAHDKGLLEGVGTAALTKGQLRVLLTLFTAATALSGTIVGLVTRLL